VNKLSEAEACQRPSSGNRLISSDEFVKRLIEAARDAAGGDEKLAAKLAYSMAFGIGNMPYQSE
jgi:hypothetical protein